MMHLRHHRVRVDIDTDPNTELTTVRVGTDRQALVIVTTDSDGQLFCVDVHEGVPAGQPVPNAKF